MEEKTAGGVNQGSAPGNPGVTKELAFRLAGQVYPHGAVIKAKEEN